MIQTNRWVFGTILGVLVIASGVIAAPAQTATKPTPLPMVIGEQHWVLARVLGVCNDYLQRPPR